MNDDAHLRRSLCHMVVGHLAGGGQPLDAADQEVVLYGVDVEGVAVAGQGHVQVARDYFARQHEVRVGGGGAWMMLRVSKVALNLFDFFPSISTAQALPVLGGGFQH